MADFDQQLERMIEKEKIARINNEHFTSVTVLKEIVTFLFNSDYALLQCKEMGEADRDD